MSEYINNATKRKEQIKNVLKQLHEGKSLEQVKADFADIIRGTDAAGIAEAEQMLIAEGVPVEEIQSLCDLHSAVFRETLDTQMLPEMLPGHPVYTFRAENQVAMQVLKGLGASLRMYMAKPDPGTLRNARAYLSRLMEYDCHYVRKENLLFPFLEKHGFSGPSKVMWGVHNDIRLQWKKLRELLSGAEPVDADAIYKVFMPLETAMTEMFYKEEKILFPAALERLTDSEWGQIRLQESEIGYFYVTPGNLWQAGKGDAAQGVRSDAGLQRPAEVVKATPQAGIPLDTGALTAEQINWMLKSLPLDVTYVDEEDTVRYFSQTKDRIFQRTEAIIGRKVQNCHPPQSLDRVQQIIDDFRAGKRDEAEFWIQMQGKFIHICYYALRDEQGKYRGVLEVTQDIGHLRSLQGEKRLLDGAPQG
ncbi:MAG: DUF438 domain-containing protein [Anaerolineae bacterium]|nr:DUF438 domain-containing protein [Anaerolineae bacterium]